jgi:hypothetical protein
VGLVVLLPEVSIAGPSALRKPGAVARTVYVPAGALRLKVPSVLASTDVTRVSVTSYRPTVTGLPANTSPLRVPFGRGVAVSVGEATGVDVKVGAAVSIGVEVAVNVGVSTGVKEVGVADSTGVEDGVAVSTGVSEVAVGEATGVKEVAVGEPTGVNEVAVGDATGVKEVGVADSTGVGEVGVGDSTGVNVAVGPLPVMVRLVPAESTSVRILSPFETRASHATGV